MKRIGAVAFASLISVSVPSLAFAHPCLCHIATFTSGFAHPLSGADHLLAMVGVGIWAAQLGGAAVWALPSGFMAALVLGGALGMAGVPMPVVEPGILGSLVVIGLAIALAWRVKPAAGFAIVALFALFHGYAHGAEMPPAGSAATYVAGFLLATAFLHAFGVGTGLLARRFDRPLLSRAAGAAISVVGLVLMVS